MSENKMSEYLNQLKKVEDVYFHEADLVTADFETNYLQVRQAESRVLSDQEVAGLPLLKNNPHSKEWDKRARSAKRLQKYFSSIPKGSLLDLGCGNGWFTALLAKNKNLEIVGMDVNLSELKQAARIFQQPNLSFVFGDIFKIQFIKNSFDFITLNASIQYFEDLKLLMNRLIYLLKPNGEIHIIDSPFYDENEIADAKKRTLEYYSKLGFPEMSHSYFHHSWSEISKWNIEVLYQKKHQNVLSRIISKPDIPFPWIKIKDANG